MVDKGSLILCKENVNFSERGWENVELQENVCASAVTYSLFGYYIVCNWDGPNDSHVLLNIHVQPWGTSIICVQLQIRNIICYNIMVTTYKCLIIIYIVLMVMMLSSHQYMADAKRICGSSTSIVWNGVTASSDTGAKCGRQQ